MPIESRTYGQLSTGQEVLAFTLSNGNSATAEVLTYGAILSSLRIPDKQKQVVDVVLGYGNLGDWETKNGPYLGAVVGRVGNRIAKGKFTLNGKEYTLATNNGANHLHGGLKGFDKQNWQAKVDGEKLALTYVSMDGEEGYPGTVTTTVTYELTPANVLRLTYHATCDADTVLLLTHHAYFNLSGAGSGSIGGHELQINAQKFVETVDLIPTGKLVPVEGTPLDFRAAKPIGRDISQLLPDGYDSCFVIDRPAADAADSMALAARISEPVTGRTMEVYTTEPGVQLYTGGCLGTQVGREGQPYVQFGGVCFETQHFPDSPNQPHFPSIVLKPGEAMNSVTEFRFI